MNAVDEYIRLAGAWGVSMEEGDSDAANSLHDRIQDVFQQVCRMKQERALFDRADGTNDATCLFIASHIKDINQHKAIALYQRLSRSAQPFIAMPAKYILDGMTKRGT